MHATRDPPADAPRISAKLHRLMRNSATFSESRAEQPRIDAASSRADGDERELLTRDIIILIYRDKSEASGPNTSGEDPAGRAGGRGVQRSGYAWRVCKLGVEGDVIYPGLCVGYLKTCPHDDVPVRAYDTANDAQILFAARREILAAVAQFDIAPDIQLGLRRGGANADVAIFSYKEPAADNVDGVNSKTSKTAHRETE